MSEATTSKPTTEPTTEPTKEPAYHVDEGAEQMHAPHLYAHDFIATPLPGLEAIDDEQVQRYHEDGFLPVANVFSPARVAAAIEAMRDLAMGKVPGFTGIQFEARAAARLHELTAEQRLDAIRKFIFFVKYDQRLADLAFDEPLLALVSRLMGGRTPEMFQDMALSKPPHIGREKPWHQDCAYFDVDPGTPVVGVWIALDEATIENGCMRLLAGAHREGPRLHWKRRDWQICDTDIEREHNETHSVVATPLPPGGALFFNGMTPHGTPHNNSGQRRRALQYHYRPTDATRISTDQRLAIYGTEGKNVEC